MNDPCQIRAWHLLPDTILFKVFLMLEESDMVQASCVCTHWRRMFYEPRFWRSMSFDLNRISMSPLEVKQKLKNHIKTIGSFVQHLTIICPGSSVMAQRQVADLIKVILDTLVKNNRTIQSFQMKQLRMNQIWKELDYEKCDLINSVCHFIEFQTCLLTLVITEALLPTTFGHMVMSSLARSPSVDTLQQLNIFYFLAFNTRENQLELLRSWLKKCTKLREIGLNYTLLKRIKVEKLCKCLEHSLEILKVKRAALNEGNYRYNNQHNDGDDLFDDEDMYDDDGRDDGDNNDDDDLDDDDTAANDLDEENAATAINSWKQAIQFCPRLRVFLKMNILVDTLADVLVPEMPVSELVIEGLGRYDDNVEGEEVGINETLKRLCIFQLDNLETAVFIGEPEEDGFYYRASENIQENLVDFLVKHPHLKSVKISSDLIPLDVFESVKSVMRVRYGLYRDVLCII